MPSGLRMRSSSTRSSGWPVTFSIMRPISENPELQYDQVAPRGWFCGSSDNSAVYFSRTSFGVGP